MFKVYNRHLGREMEYPYAESHSKKQFAFVFNMNRCIGCQTCTMACKSTWTFSEGQESMWWNNVETKPYGGYPQFWDMKLLKSIDEKNGEKQRWNITEKSRKSPYGVFEGKTIFEVASKNYVDKGAQRAVGYLPPDAEWMFPNIYEDTAKKTGEKPPHLGGKGVSLPTHDTWFFYLPRICNHCEYPACLASCPRKAIYKRPEDGIVLVDQKRCRGYRKCIEGCPYKKVMFRGTTGVSEKCIACYPRIEGQDSLTDNRPVQSRCMSACVGKIRLQGFINSGQNGQWEEKRDNPLFFLIKIEKVALPLYPQFGTQPNGYYIPPRWVPIKYLRQMFGPGADEAIEKYIAPSRELLAVLQLFGTIRKIISSYKIVKGKKIFERKIRGRKWEMYDDTIIGFGIGGEEIIRTKVEEPFFERAPEYLNSI